MKAKKKKRKSPLLVSRNLIKRKFQVFGMMEDDLIYKERRLVQRILTNPHAN